MDTQKKLISFGTLFNETWNVYLSRFKTLISIAILPAFIFFLGISGIGLGGILATTVGYLFIVAGVIFYLFSALALIYAIKEGVGFTASYRLAVNKIFAYLWINILSLLIVLGGFLMGIIPGFVFSIWFVFAGYIFVSEGQKGMSALLKSKEYARGYWWPVFWRCFLLGLVLTGVSIAIVLPAAFIDKTVGDIVNSIIEVFLTPFVVLYTYLLYRKLAELKPEIATVAVTAKKGFFVFASILGIISSVLLTIGAATALILLNPGE